MFPSPTRKDTPFTNYGAAARRVQKAAKLADDWRVYDLKSTALTAMKEQLNVPPHVLSAIANHLSGSITDQHYAFGSYETEKREALEAWGRHVEKVDPATRADVVELKGRRRG